MMRRLNARFICLLGVAALIVAVWLLPLPVASASSQHTFLVDARQFEFTPGRIEVNQGDLITFKLTASDVVHGFYLDGYSIERPITPGISQEVTFVADQPGKFRFRCSVSCGALHPFMIGEFVVNGNAPLWRAAGTIGVSLIGILVYLWHFGRNEG